MKKAHQSEDKHQNYGIGKQGNLPDTFTVHMLELLSCQSETVRFQ
jgi:hypothetical protein